MTEHLRPSEFVPRTTFSVMSLLTEAWTSDSLGPKVRVFFDRSMGKVISSLLGSWAISHYVASASRLSALSFHISKF